MSIDFVSVILFVGMGQCLFLIITLLLSKSDQQLANRLLILLILAFLWYQFEFFLLRQRLDTQIPFLYSSRYGSWLLIGPLILLYNRASLIKGYSLRKKELLHFLPFLIFTIIIPLGLGDVITNRATHYGMLTVFDRFNREPVTLKHYIYGIIFIVQYIHAVGYILIAFRETRKLEKLAKNTTSNLEPAKVNTLLFLYASAFLIILLCACFMLYQFMTTMWKRNMDYLYVLPTLIFVFGLAYRAIRYPNSILISEDESSSEKYAKSGLTEQAKKSLLQKLIEKMEREKLYRDNELRLADLAEALDVSTHHLSQLINEHLNQNFFDLINGYRVSDAKEKIAEGASKTLLQVAFEVGFNNKNSFNSAFKKHVGMTPSAFKKNNLTG